MTDLPYTSWEDSFRRFLDTVQTETTDWTNEERATCIRLLDEYFEESRKADQAEGIRVTYNELLDAVIGGVELDLFGEGHISRERILALMTDLETAKEAHKEREQMRIRETENRPPESFIRKR